MKSRNGLGCWRAWPAAWPTTMALSRTAAKLRATGCTRHRRAYAPARLGKCRRNRLAVVVDQMRAAVGAHVLLRGIDLQQVVDRGGKVVRAVGRAGDPLAFAVGLADD